MSLIALLFAGFLVVKAAERWGTSLALRYRQRSVMDVSTIGFDIGGGPDGTCGGAG